MGTLAFIGDSVILLWAENRQERKRPGSELGELIESHIKDWRIGAFEESIETNKSWEKSNWKTTINGGFNGKITYEYEISHTSWEKHL